MESLHECGDFFVPLPIISAQRKVRRWSSGRTMEEELRKNGTTGKGISLLEAVMGSVHRTFEIKGLEAAEQEYAVMRSLFSHLKDAWYDIEGEAQDFFEAKHRQRQVAEAERQRLIDEAVIKGLTMAHRWPYEGLGGVTVSNVFNAPVAQVIGNADKINSPIQNVENGTETATYN